jgi:hypothetical protein
LQSKLNIGMKIMEDAGHINGIGVTVPTTNRTISTTSGRVIK